MPRKSTEPQHRSPARLSIGIVGAGRIAALHARCLTALPEARLAAVADSDPRALSTFAEQNAIAAADRHAEAESFLAREDIDAVYICVPPTDHASLTLAALDAGKHVFVEKPLATRLEDLEPIIARARQSQRHVQVGHVTRFDRELIHLRQLVRDGHLGDVYRVRARSLSPFLPTGWHGDPEVAGGGILTDGGTHAIDALRFVLGDPPCDGAEARMGNAFGVGRVEDHLVALLQFGPTLVTLECGYGLDRRWGGSSADLELFGTRGRARNRPFRAAFEETKGEGQEWRETVDIPPDTGGALPSDGEELFLAQARFFVSGCSATTRHGSDSLSSAVEVVRIVDALYQSARRRPEISPPAHLSAAHEEQGETP